MSDWNMPNKTGIEFLQELRASGNEMPFGFITCAEIELCAPMPIHPLRQQGFLVGWADAPRITRYACIEFV